MKALELKGRRFKRLLVVQDIDRGHELKWKCKCDCGKIIIARGADLNRGYIKSCGCWNSEVTTRRNTKHNMSDSRFHKIWIAMRQRCNNPKSSRYRLYGGRGIGVCDRWNEFVAFKVDMLGSYKKHCRIYGLRNTSLDRINNNGNYEPANCRWATQKEQVHNRRKEK